MSLLRREKSRSLRSRKDTVRAGDWACETHAVLPSNEVGKGWHLSARVGGFLSSLCIRQGSLKQRLASGTVFSILLALSASLCFVKPAKAEPSQLPPEVGYDYGEYESPRTAAMGGATRAIGGSVDALYANPANMAVSRVYHVAGFAQVWPEANRQAYGAAIVDSLVSSSRLAGGLGGYYSLQDPSGIDRTMKSLRFALALPLGDKFFVGAAGHQLWLTEKGNGPLGPSVISSGLVDKTVVSRPTFDAAATLMPTRALAISLVGSNLTAPADGFQPLSLGGGVGYGTRDVSIEGDVVADFRTWNKTTVRAMGGGEVLVGDHFPVRAGYRFDQGNLSHAISGGFGYIDRVIGLELAVRRVLGDHGATAIFLGLVYHLDSSEMAPTPDDSF